MPRRRSGESARRDGAVRGWPSDGDSSFLRDFILRRSRVRQGPRRCRAVAMQLTSHYDVRVSEAALGVLLRGCNILYPRCRYVLHASYMPADAAVLPRLYGAVHK